MVVKYSALNRLETPKFTLCSPGSIYKDGLLTNVVGVLVDHEAEEIVFNFNSTSELNIRVNKIRREDANDNKHVYTLYKSIQNRRLIFVEDIGYFMIMEVDDDYSEGVHYKDIKAQSIDVEIQQKKVPYIVDGTYRFLTDNTGTNKGILETVVEVLPLWTIGHVDEDVAKKYRTFKDVDTDLNCLGFLLDNVQDAYECIILFDIIERTINVYSQDNYVRQTNVHITKDDLINSIDITENAEDLYTAISVMGDDNITISAINPLGSNVIYDFSYYLDWMSDGLQEKVKMWQERVNSVMDDYYKLNEKYYTTLEEISNLQSELKRIETLLTMYNRCLNNIVAESSVKVVNSYNDVIAENNGEKLPEYSDIEEAKSHIKKIISEYESEYNRVYIRLNGEGNDVGLSSVLAEYRDDIDVIRRSVAFTKKQAGEEDDTETWSNFTDEEYEELSHYIFEGSYTDEYVTITSIMSYTERFEQMKILYDRAKSRLERVSKPTQEFSIDVENFIFAKDFEEFSKQLETGCLINVELDDDDIAALFLSAITVNYDDHKLSMTFGNRFNKFDTKSLFDDVLGNIKKSANTLNYVKEILYPIKSGEFNQMREAIQTSRNLTMGGALASINEEVIIDESGYTGKKKLEDGTYDPHQVKITGKNIVFTDDAWESCKVAIGEILLGEGEQIYGINAQAIIGDIIMGNNLRIIDDDGNDLLKVVDDEISARIEEVDGSISQITQRADEIVASIKTIRDEIGKDVDHVVTETGYTFNADGLTIHKTGDDIKNTLDNTGMYVKRYTGGGENQTEDVLTANTDGVNAINLTARQYLIVGSNSRFEDYSNGKDAKRTACFYIGK